MKRRMIAPTTAAMIDPISPPAAMPNRPNNQPPISEPITPTTILPTRPKPAPFMITPASHPATAPISKKMMRPVSVMGFDLPPGAGPLAAQCHATVTCNHDVVTSEAKGFPVWPRLDERLFKGTPGVPTLGELRQADREAVIAWDKWPATFVPGA